jgi:uncharacterized membrane protein YfcA
MLPLLLLFTAAVLAGLLNGVAGGGGLIAFPALLFAGVEPINANATNTAALWVGTAASTVAYHQEFTKQHGEIVLLSGTSIIGGIFGSYLLLHTSSGDFARLIPYLMLIATLLFTVNQPLMKWLKMREKNCSARRLPIVFVLLIQLVIATYGGFFGGGAGILMLALLEMMGMKNVHTMNAVKSWLATCLNGVAIIHFILAGTIIWHKAILMASGALIGGYASAYFARQLHPVWVRCFIIFVSVLMTSYFLVREVI